MRPSNHNTNTIKMSIFATLLLALGMSMDAFAAALARGAASDKPLSAAGIAKTALAFGLVEMCAPLIGWAAGSAAASFISEWDHWAAFVLLSILGLRMIREGCGADGNDGENGAAEKEKTVKRGGWFLLLTAVATSIDSMVVGVGLAFLDVGIVVTALAIGCATTIMAALGLKLGRILGTKIGKRAEMLGGIVLIGIGVSVLVEHLGLLG